MTPRQRALARHALGLPNRDSRSYRNHFVAGPGHADHEEWTAMVTADLATRREGSPLSGDDDVFWLTEVGARAALERRETLDPENIPEAMIATRVTITRVEERHRKEWVSGHGDAAVTREVSTGWRVVVDCGGGSLALGAGAKQPDLAEGPALLRLENINIVEKKEVSG